MIIDLIQTLFPYLVVAYLIGSIPFGLVLTRMAGLGDIRAIGSGNIGATNVLRTGNKVLALLTLIGDTGKGAAAVCLMAHFDIATTTSASLLVGLAAILGHCFPIWLQFKGGKGVATTIGTVIAAAPMTGLFIVAFWLMTAGLFKISSLAALVAMASAPITAYVLYGETPAIICLAITALVYIRHKDNIKRLASGTEPKSGQKKK